MVARLEAGSGDSGIIRYGPLCMSGAAENTENGAKQTGETPKTISLPRLLKHMQQKLSLHLLLYRSAPVGSARTAAGSCASLRQHPSPPTHDDNPPICLATN